MENHMAMIIASMLEEQVALMQKTIVSLKEFHETNMKLEFQNNNTNNNNYNNQHSNNNTQDEATSTAPKKRAKKIVDPNRPKRPLTGYQLYMADHSVACRESNPDSNIMPLLANGWSNLLKDMKEEYQTRAKILKEKYQVELQEYLASGGKLVDVVNNNEHHDDYQHDLTVDLFDKNTQNSTNNLIETGADSSVSNTITSSKVDGTTSNSGLILEEKRVEVVGVNNETLNETVHYDDDNDNNHLIFIPTTAEPHETEKKKKKKKKTTESIDNDDGSVLFESEKKKKVGMLLSFKSNISCIN